MKDRWTAIGTVPPSGEEAELARFVGETSDGRIWATKSLSTDCPEADYPEIVSGVLAVPCRRSREIICSFSAKSVCRPKLGRQSGKNL